MADIHLWSGATGLNNGTSWVDAYTNDASAYAAWTTGDRVLMAHDHSHSDTNPTGLSISSKGTYVDPVYILRVDRITGTVYTSYSEVPNLTVSGPYSLSNVVGYISGINVKTLGISNITLDCGVVSKLLITRCKYTAGGGINIGDTGTTVSRIIIEDSVLEVGVTSTTAKTLTMNSSVHYKNTRLVGLSDKTTTFIANSNNNNRLSIYDYCVFDVFSGGYILNPTYQHEFTFNSTAFLNGVGILAPAETTSYHSTFKATFNNCDFGGTNRESRVYTRNGEMTTDNSIVSSSAFRISGVTPISFKLVPYSECNKFQYIESVKLEAIIPNSGTYLVDVYGYEDFTSPLTKGDAWLNISSSADPGDSVFETTLSLDSTTSLELGDQVFAGATGGRQVKFSIPITVTGPCILSATVALGKYEVGKSLWINPLLNITPV